jgi:hypothetical protein
MPWTISWFTDVQIVGPGFLQDLRGETVELRRGDPGSHRRAARLQHRRHDATGHPHLVHLRLRLERDHVLIPKPRGAVR